MVGTARKARLYPPYGLAFLASSAPCGLHLVATKRSEPHAVFHAEPGQTRPPRQAGGGHLLRAVAFGVRAGVLWQAGRPARLPGSGSLPARGGLPRAEHRRRPWHGGEINSEAAGSALCARVFANSDKFARSDLPAFRPQPVTLRPLNKHHKRRST